MEYRKISLKAHGESVEQALAICEIEIEKAKRENVKAIKFIHGYGSSGKGGAIAKELRIFLRKLQRQKIIKIIILGIDFRIENPVTQKLLACAEAMACDEDLGHSNPGVTVVVI